MGWRPVGRERKVAWKSERVVRHSVAGSRPSAVPDRLEGHGSCRRERK